MDEGAGRRIDRIAVELEPRPPVLDGVELLLLVLGVGLVVLVDDPGTCLAGCTGVDLEGCDPEVVPDRSPRAAPVRELLDLFKVNRSEAAHTRAEVSGRGV